MKKLIVAAVVVVGVLCGAADCSPQPPPGGKHDGGNILPVEAAKSKKQKSPKFVLGEPTSQVTACVFQSSNCGAKK